MTKSTIRKTDYSHIAEYYDKARPTPHELLLSKIIEYGKIAADSKVLDIGCGTGRFSLDLSTKKTASFYALEPSIEMLKEAVSKDGAKRILWVQGDGQALPFRDSLFDCIYMTLVIHHIEDQKGALREIYQALKPDGHCVIMTVSHSQIRKHVLNDFPGMTAIDLKRFPSIPSLKKAMKEIGFGQIHHHRVQYDEREVPIEEYLERVRNKYISTLTLLSEKAFRKGLETFQQKLRRKQGVFMRRTVRFTFVVGRK